jgi:hypothetical protein
MTGPTNDCSEARPRLGLYVFCFARARALDVARGPGITADSPLRLLADGDLAALACEVPLDDWEGPLGEAHTTDIGWLAPRALRHEQVIEEAMAFSPVLPLRFGCLFSSEQRLCALIGRARPAIDAFLAEAAQREEWSIRGLLDAAACEEVLLSAERRQMPPPPSPGARYLVEQKMRQRAARAVRVWVKSAEVDIARALDGVAFEIRAGRCSQAAVDGRELAFCAALWVPRGAAMAMERCLAPLGERLSACGLQIEARGPWPPYTFAPRLDEEPAALERFAP